MSELLRMMRAVGDGGGQKCEFLNKGADEIERLRDLIRVADVFRQIIGQDLRELKSAQDAGHAGGLDTPRLAALKAAVAEYDRGKEALEAASI